MFINLTPINRIIYNRTKGKSKAGAGEIFAYLKNLSNYWVYRRKAVDEFVKFGLVGTFGAIINLSILYSFTEFLGIYYVISAIFAFAVAVTSNFFLNKIWTFKEKVHYKISKKYGQFIFVALIALGFNLVILYSLTEFLKIYYLLSQIIAKGAVFIINFFGNKFWTFKK